MSNWNANEIRELRKALELSQAAFGEAIGVTRMHVYYLERGERTASKTLRILFDILASKGKRKRGGKGDAKGPIQKR